MDWIGPRTRESVAAAASRAAAELSGMDVSLRGANKKGEPWLNSMALRAHASALEAVQSAEQYLESGLHWYQTAQSKRLGAYDLLAAGEETLRATDPKALFEERRTAYPQVRVGVALLALAREMVSETHRVTTYDSTRSREADRLHWVGLGIGAAKKINDLALQPLRRFVFSFGADMDGTRIKRLEYSSNDAIHLGRASLAEYQFVIEPRRLVSIHPKAGGTVHGVLWSVTELDEADIDTFRGVEKGLSKKIPVVVVNAKNEQIRATTYVPGEKAAARPHDAPLHIVNPIIEIGKKSGLPPGYLAELEALTKSPK